MRALAFAVMLGLGWQARGADIPEWVTSCADNKVFRSLVTEAALEKAPLWTQRLDRPPLSPGLARDLASRQLQQLTGDSKKWDLGEIALIDTGDHLHWIYVVRFTFHIPKDVEYIGGPQYFNIAVLMDGTVIKPEVVPFAK